ncbi:hypothetical protein Dsui_2824 [Azospira oryzae PS]|uniref:Uncharacterized protein n=1 Tax=Azospira oryzae (strain ATCC BAA-33 / DSM 13638 / PS) TaxID=640081 RepID=G8QFQ0_AZOOP|nr:hypothetical protein Dsui_2824 [Azospira oryzae PS]
MSSKCYLEKIGDERCQMLGRDRFKFCKGNN